MKSLTRRELLTELFSKDIMKTFAGAYREFNKAQDNARKAINCDEAGLMLGRKSKIHTKKFFQKLGKEG